MHIFWESIDWPGAKVEPGLTCLTWLPQSNGQGLLGSGSQSGSVGVTKTDIDPNNNKSKSEQNSVSQKRVNFNLRGHHSPISIVAWNQAQSKLATCDEGGVIYVWVPYEERWSVELVNDRGVKVRDFAWSSNGQSALICYEDNFVLIGSATGQRIWSFTYQQNILCGVWSPDSAQVVIGSNNGNMHLLTDQGGTIGEYTIWADHPVEKVAWSSQRSSDLKSTLSACFRNGSIYFMESCDDADPFAVHTELNVVAIQWTLSGEYLAVMGYKSEAEKTTSRLLVFSGDGKPVLNTDIPGTTAAVTAFTWAHDDQSVVLAAGGEICVGRVVTDVPSLQMLASHKTWSTLSDRLNGAQMLPLPIREKGMVNVHNCHLVQCQIPTPKEMCDSVCRPSEWRWYCTIRPVPRHAQTYTLCMEHMSGLVPVLIGKQINKFLPEFEIRFFRPGERSGSRSRSGTPDIGSEDDSIPDITDIPDSARKSPQATGGASTSSHSPATNFQRGNFQRDSVWRRSKRQLQAIVQRAQHHAHSPELQARKEDKLVQLTSNVWCTRFKLLGMVSEILPPYIGQVLYKTSVLHLQPRQMTVQVVDLENYSTASNPVPPPPAESDTDGADENLMRTQQDEGPPIAPMDSEIFVGGVRGENFGAENTEEEEDPLLAEEQALLNQVLHEFGELRTAVDSHIQRMREFAVDLQQSSQQLNNRRSLATTKNVPQLTGAKKTKKPNTPDIQPSTSSGAEKQKATGLAAEPPKNFLLAPTEMSKMSCEAVIAESSVADQNIEDSSPEMNNNTKPAKRWDDCLDDLAFIDEDETLVVTSDKEKERLRARSLSYDLPISGSPSSGQATEGTPVFREQTEATSHTHAVKSRRKVSAAAGASSRRSSNAHLHESHAQVPRTYSEHYGSDITAVAEAVGEASAVFAQPVDGRGSTKQLKEITSVLDKLYKLANELTTRPGISDSAGSNSAQGGPHGAPGAAALLPPHPQSGGKVCPHRNLAPGAMLMETEPGPYNQLRERIRDIAQRVSQLERRINYGNELLDDVRSDLQRRVSHIRNVLGDPKDVPDTTGCGGNRPKSKRRYFSGSSSAKGLDKENWTESSTKGTKDNISKKNGRVLSLQNKAPFWNEQSQVYQLDFGGRVTQESAKNFQIEHEEKQVMQFGRIDNGAYTLDFQAPFTAVQAFAVALASITQRLK